MQPLTSFIHLIPIWQPEELAFALIRWFLLTLIIWQWPRLIHKLGQRKNWPTEWIQHLARQRGWLLGFVLVVEALLWY